MHCWLAPGLGTKGSSELGPRDPAGLQSLLDDQLPLSKGNVGWRPGELLRVLTVIGQKSVAFGRQTHFFCLLWLNRLFKRYKNLCLSMGGNSEMGISTTGKSVSLRSYCTKVRLVFSL